MATKTKLEKAVSERAEELGGAQKELVMSQFAVYKRNSARISEIEESLRALDRAQVDPVERRAQRTALSYEKHQLESSNTEIMSTLFGKLGE